MNAGKSDTFGAVPAEACGAVGDASRCNSDVLNNNCASIDNRPLMILTILIYYHF
jgi:hypothetical protein